MSYLSDISAGGIDPLRDHRTDADVHNRSVRFAARVTKADPLGLVSVHDGTQDTLGDISCAAFWPKSTRSISGWAFAWPAVVARGQVTTGGAGGGTTPTTPTVVVTPDGGGNAPGAGVTYSRGASAPAAGTTQQTGGTVAGGGGSTSTKFINSGPGQGAVYTPGYQGDQPASTSPSGGITVDLAKDRLNGALPGNIVVHRQDFIKMNPTSVDSAGT